MADVFTKAKRSEVMSRIRSRGNRDTELALAALLRAHKITGWRRHRLLRVARPGPKSKVQSPKSRGSQPSTLNHQLTVRPDFVFLKSRTVIFVDGCFWHGCPRHATRPRNNRAFWHRKLEGNKQRDALVTRTLRRAGWRVLRVWEHELAKKNETRLVRRIRRALRTN